MTRKIVSFQTPTFYSHGTAAAPLLAQRLRRFVDQVRFLRQDHAQALDLLVGFLPAFLFDGQHPSNILQPDFWQGQA
jgi:hypothetical protein